MAPTDNTAIEQSINNSQKKLAHVARSIGVVDAKSKLHFAAAEGKRHSQDRSRWRILDWLLGTQIGQLLSLIVMAVLLLVAGALVWMTTGGQEDMYDDSFDQALWFSWGMFFDPGTQMGFAATHPLKIKAVAVFFSIAGFVYNLIFLGVIVDVVRASLELWRRQRGRIVANRHTLLLGWNQKSLFLIGQLKQCSENQGEAFKLVILADEDELMVKNELKRHFGPAISSRMVSVRSGSPFECNDLERVSARSAKKIIVLSGAGSATEEDRSIVRNVIALASLPQAPSCPIVAEVGAPETSQAIKVMMDTAEGIYARDAVCRVMCLAAIQPAIGDVYKQIMSWEEGAEVYVRSLADLEISTARTIGEAQMMIERGAIIGVRPMDELSILAVPEDHKLQPTDNLLILAESLVDLQNGPQRRLRNKLRNFMRKPAPAEEGTTMRRSLTAEDLRHTNWSKMNERKLVIVVGWPSDVDDLMIAFEDYLEPGSEVIFFASLHMEARLERMTENSRSDHTRLRITHKIGNPTSVYALAQLPLNEAHAVMVVADEEHSGEPTKADSNSIHVSITVDGLLRGSYSNVFTPTFEYPPRLVCEVLSASTERALKSGRSIGKDSLIHFFHSGALETGLFTIASTETPVFNALLMLLQPNDFGDIIGLTVDKYLSKQEMAGTPFTKAQMFKRVRENNDVLLSVVSPSNGEVLVGPLHLEESLVDPKALLLVVSRRRRLTSKMAEAAETVQSLAGSAMGALVTANATAKSNAKSLVENVNSFASNLAASAKSIADPGCPESEQRPEVNASTVVKM